jgi:hypothetical protein
MTTPEKTPENAVMFGTPGIEPRWTSSAKEGVGTAYHTSRYVAQAFQPAGSGIFPDASLYWSGWQFKGRVKVRPKPVPTT